MKNTLKRLRILESLHSC